MGLLKALKAKKDKQTKNAIIIALGELGDPKAIPTLNQERRKANKKTKKLIDEAIEKIQEKNQQ